MFFKILIWHSHFKLYQRKDKTKLPIYPLMFKLWRENSLNSWNISETERKNSLAIVYSWHWHTTKTASSLCSVFRKEKEQLLLNVCRASHHLPTPPPAFFFTAPFLLFRKFIRISSTKYPTAHMIVSLQITYLTPFSDPISWSPETLSLRPKVSHQSSTKSPVTSPLFHIALT